VCLKTVLPLPPTAAHAHSRRGYRTPRAGFDERANGLVHEVPVRVMRTAMVQRHGAHWSRPRSQAAGNG
jgi:hypothetical protein